MTSEGGKPIGERMEHVETVQGEHERRIGDLEDYKETQGRAALTQDRLYRWVLAISAGTSGFIGFFGRDVFAWLRGHS